jgi:hypothetical protein
MACESIEKNDFFVKMYVKKEKTKEKLLNFEKAVPKKTWNWN